jgi:hypothetical protein
VLGLCCVESSHRDKLVRLQLKDELHVQVGCSVKSTSGAYWTRAGCIAY